MEYEGSLSAITDMFIVKLKEGTSYAQLQELADKTNSMIGEEDEFVKNQYNLYVSKISDLDAMQTANLFYETGMFEFAEPNLIDFYATQSLDPLFYDQWGLKNTGQDGGTSGVDIKAEQAWAITSGTSSVRIAIIDNGIDLTHPDLQANLLSGYDATGHGTYGGIYNNNDKHGTQVAGVSAAIGNNNKGISGVAPNCKIVPVKVGMGTTSFARDLSSAGINWVVNNNKAEVINCSFSSNNPPSSNLTNAINNAVTNGRGGKGCVVVCSSGNEESSTVNYPANLPNVIAVGAITRNGVREDFSNYGTSLDVVAPGSGIWTTTLNGGYTTEVGTSIATPHVSGVAALILSQNPALTVWQVTDIIERTASKVGSYTYSFTSGRYNGGWNNQTGYGLVNAYAALISVTSSITGPEVVCASGGSVFTVNQPPSNYTWTYSSNLTAGTTNGNNRTFYAANSNVSGEGWVAINLNGVEVARKTVGVGKPSLVDLLCESLYNFPAGTMTDWNVSPYLTPGSTIHWDVYEINGGYAEIVNSSPASSYASIHFNEPGSFTVVATVTNACGTANIYKNVVVY